MVISSLNQLSLLHDGTRHELTTFQFNVCKHSCSNRTSLSIRFEQQHRCDTILQVFSFKNKTKAKLKDIEAAYFVRTENIHPIFDKIKVGVSYRLCMRVFSFNLCKNGTSIQRNMSLPHVYSLLFPLLIGYSRICGCYYAFLYRGLLTRKLLNQRFLVVTSSSRKG